MKKLFYILFVAILVIFNSFVAFSDTATKEVRIKTLIMQPSAVKFKALNPATQTNQSGIPSYKKIFKCNLSWNLF